MEYFNIQNPAKVMSNLLCFGSIVSAGILVFGAVVGNDKMIIISGAISSACAVSSCCYAMLPTTNIQIHPVNIRTTAELVRVRNNALAEYQTQPRETDTESENSDLEANHTNRVRNETSTGRQI